MLFIQKRLSYKSLKTDTIIASGDMVRQYLSVCPDAAIIHRSRNCIWCLLTNKANPDKKGTFKEGALQKVKKRPVVLLVMSVFRVI
jgi:hypothetical protein